MTTDNEGAMTAEQKARVQYFVDAFEMNGVGDTVAKVQDSPGTHVAITIADLRALLAVQSGQASNIEDQAGLFDIGSGLPVLTCPCGSCRKLCRDVIAAQPAVRWEVLSDDTWEQVDEHVAARAARGGHTVRALCVRAPVSAQPAQVMGAAPVAWIGDTNGHEDVVIKSVTKPYNLENAKPLVAPFPHITAMFLANAAFCIEHWPSVDPDKRQSIIKKLLEASAAFDMHAIAPVAWTSKTQLAKAKANPLVAVEMYKASGRFAGGLRGGEFVGEIFNVPLFMIDADLSPTADEDQT